MLSPYLSLTVPPESPAYAKVKNLSDYEASVPSRVVRRCIGPLAAWIRLRLRMGSRMRGSYLGS